jgi:hypothetical protein
VQQRGVLRHHADPAARRLSWVTLAMSWPSIRMRPASGLVEAQQQVDQGRLAGAGAADEADALAGRAMERREVVQHAALGAVAEADVLERGCAPAVTASGGGAGRHRASGAATAMERMPSWTTPTFSKMAVTLSATQPDMCADLPGQRQDHGDGADIDHAVASRAAGRWRPCRRS